MKNEIKLVPADSRKSFYGKARCETKNGTIILFSYNTPVAAWKNGVMFRLWHGYSNTTMRHVDSFSVAVRGVRMHKADWLTLPMGYRSEFGV